MRASDSWRQLPTTCTSPTARGKLDSVCPKALLTALGRSGLRNAYALDCESSASCVLVDVARKPSTGVKQGLVRLSVAPCLLFVLAFAHIRRFN